MAEFEYKEDDHEGLETLEAVGSAFAFNKWMYEQVKPWMKGEVLEIGSGIGNISSFFLEDKTGITVSDIRNNYCSALKERFAGEPSLRKVLSLDLVDPGFHQKYASLLNNFDSAFALNVIEHIQDDLTALRNLGSLIKPEGNIVILVPAGQWLYNRLDKNLYHFKRYSKKEMEKQMKAAGLKVDKSWFFNALGIPAWFYGGSILKEDTIKSTQMNTYDKLVPLARLIDKATLNKIGLSVIVKASKL